MSEPTVDDHMKRMIMEIQLSAEGRDAECLAVEESYQMTMKAIKAQYDKSPVNSGVHTGFSKLLAIFKK